MTKYAWLVMIAAVPAYACPNLMFEQGWVREPPPGVEVAAGFVTLHNTGSHPLVINGIGSDEFGHVMLHETRTEGSISRMAALDSLTLAPNERVVLAPGGKHLMLMQARHVLSVGASVHVVFECGDSRATAELTVRRDSP